MRKAIIGVVAVVLLIGVYLIAGYNGLVTKSEEVDNAFANIDTNLQRRADLIPNLVSTVKEYAKHENEVFDKVLEARKMMVDAKEVDEKANADSELTKALDALMVVVEDYPDLKASQNFQQLSDELAGTENRIAVSRRDYNDTVKQYNSKIKHFPTNILAGMFGFESKNYFKADEGSSTVPTVSFD